MLLSSILVSVLAVAGTSALPSVSDSGNTVAKRHYNNDYDYSNDYHHDYKKKQEWFPWCKKWVKNPAWGGDGKPYGKENGQSCIAREGQYGDDYGHDDYDKKDDYSDYDKKDDYDDKDYDKKDDYKEDYDDKDYDDSSDDYVSPGDYASGTKYAAAKYVSHGHSYSDDYGSGDRYSCSYAIPYFKRTHSPTLKQCAANACAQSYYGAVKHCFELERAARRNNHGRLPRGW